MAEQQQQKKEEKKPTIEILHDAPIKSDEGWEITIWTILKKGLTPLDGVMVTVFCSGQEKGSNFTNSEGRMSPITIIIPKNKPWIQVEVYAQSTPSAFNKKLIPLTQLTPTAGAKTPAIPTRTTDEWNPRATGKDGDYTIYVSLTSQDRLPLSGVLVFAYHLDTKGRLAEGRTDKDGLAVLKLKKFTEKYREIVLEAVGTQMPLKTLRLYGPSMEKKHPKVPAIPEEDENLIGWNPLNALRLMWRSWKRGGQANREQNTKRS